MSDNTKIRLRQIDKENWRFILYQTENEQFVASFPYSPTSFVDLSMFILLTADEKDKVEADRQFLIDFSDDVRNNFRAFLPRATSANEYLIF